MQDNTRRPETFGLPRLHPITSTNTSRYNSSGCIRLCPQVIAKGPASRSSAPSASEWMRFVHPEVQPYFVFNGESNFVVVTEADIGDMPTERRIFACLNAVNKELRHHDIKIPPRCELFLELGEDHTFCNYYFVDHIGRGLFWLEDLGVVLTDTLVMSHSRIEKALERLYWVHVEYFPMHRKHHEQGFSQIMNDVCSDVSGQKNRLTPMASIFIHAIDRCKHFLKQPLKKKEPPLSYYGDGQLTAAGKRSNEPRKLNTQRRKHVKRDNVTMDDIRSSVPHDLTSYVTTLGDFPLASGTYGDIYKGKLCMGERSTDVAIKAYKMYSQHDGHQHRKINWFHSEILVWLKLEHPNVLPLFGTIRDPNMHPFIPAMVSPWMENGALSSYLVQSKDLTPARRLILANDVAHGLQYLHSQHVIHGDLSGSNILIHADGSACIADFGLSTLLIAMGGATFATSRQTKGTVRWMAPELFCFDDKIITATVQSDVYSFGSIMLQILTGNIPYHHLPRDEQVIAAISRGTRPDRLDQRLVTDGRWKFIERCWSMDPDEPRPLSGEVVEFTQKELRECMTARVV